MNSPACPFDRAAIVALNAQFSPPARIRKEPHVAARVTHAAAGIMAQFKRAERDQHLRKLLNARNREEDRRRAEAREKQLHKHNCTRLQSPFDGMVWVED